MGRLVEGSCIFLVKEFHCLDSRSPNSDSTRLKKNNYSCNRSSCKQNYCSNHHLDHNYSSNRYQYSDYSSNSLPRLTAQPSSNTRYCSKCSKVRNCSKNCGRCSKKIMKHANSCLKKEDYCSTPFENKSCCEIRRCCNRCCKSINVYSENAGNDTSMDPAYDVSNLRGSDYSSSCNSYDSCRSDFR